MTVDRRGRVVWLGVAGIALAATLIEAPGAAALGATQMSPNIASVKAGFLYNFAKFTEWPALAAGAPIAMCVVGNERIADALAETVREQRISGHALGVQRPSDSATWRACHLLFVADADRRRFAGGLDSVRTLQVLTISDGRDFSQAGGIIELFVENGKMRFAINVDAVERSGLRLSSRLLLLAKIIRERHVQ